ncbi:aspartate 1-decarboxylase [Ahniella affigens]|uniref:Aspartate 1-decarboxylase n=2 Tax=Ahniella affigens TaxID=2021234 RepID=A0A2P1PQP6_9GAMM|nr:aspartate 1-decarboxylase [Ahniella affigens]
MIRLMHAKIHRAKITACHLDYMGSLTIDPIWMEQVGLLPLEEIQVVNVTNANRFVTYAIPGTRGEGQIEPNGACAHLCKVGDIVIIYAMKSVPRENVIDSGHLAKVLIFGADGTPELLHQHLSTNGEQFSFDSQPVDLPERESIAA